jgi:hypothetical protein
VHLLHATLNPSTGCHPNRAIIQVCFLWLCSDFQAEGEPLNQFAFKVILIIGMYFFFHPRVFSGYEIDIGLDLWVCAFLKYGNCVKL